MLMDAITASSRGCERQRCHVKRSTPFTRSCTRRSGITLSGLPRLFLVVGFSVVLANLLSPSFLLDVAGGDINFDNVNVDTNNLGLLMSKCSTFCHAGVLGVDLWLSFLNACPITGLSQAGFDLDVLEPSDPNSYTGPAALSTYYSGGTGWTLVQSMFVCATVTTLGLFSGFRFGTRMASSEPKSPFQPIL